MASSPPPSQFASHFLLLLLLLLISPSLAIRPSPSFFKNPTSQNSPLVQSFARAPMPYHSVYPGCSINGDVNIAMTLDFDSLRGLVSSIFSILSHSSCPNNLRFHFLVSADDHHNDDDKYRDLLEFIFPWLSFQISTFERKNVQTLVDKKFAPDSLSYARAYLADVLPSSVDKVIYLSPTVIALDDIVNLWSTRFRHSSSVVAAPRYCVGKKRCYFKTGVMVVDLGRWREGKYSERVEELMVRMQKGEWIYDPMVAAFRGAAEGIDERWDRIESDLDGYCNLVYGEGEVSLVHWSAMKPWERSHGGEACEDRLLSLYDLYRRPWAT